MFSGAHAIFYSTDADADRAFVRDVLGFPGVDAGQGWLIFRLPPAELAFHPTTDEPKHELYLMCDDITAQVEEFTAKGVELTRPVSDQPWGRIAAVRLPSGGELAFYEPRHPVAHSL